MLRPLLSVPFLLLLSTGSVLGADREGSTTDDGTWIADDVKELPGLPMGPFVRVSEERILTFDTAQSVLVSSDEGKTWESRSVLDPEKYSVRPQIT